MMRSFDDIERAAVMAAISDPDPENEIAKAIAVRIEAMNKIVVDAVQRAGGMPRFIEFSKPITAIDEAAIALFHTTMHDEYAVMADKLGKELSDMPPMPRIVILDHGKQ